MNTYLLTINQRWKTNSTIGKNISLPTPNIILLMRQKFSKQRSIKKNSYSKIKKKK